MLFAFNSRAQIQLACNDHIQVSLDENCFFTVNLDMLLEAPPLDTTCLIIEIYDENGDVIPNNQFNSSHRDLTFDYAVKDTCAVNSCWGSISVEDKLPPQFECNPFDTVWCSQTDYVLQLDTVIEACGTVERIIISDVSVDYPCDSMCAGKRFITYYYVDESGNESNICVKEICFRRATLDTVMMPDDTIFSCSNFIDAMPSRTGVPQVDGYPIYPNSHFCEINCTYSDQILDICPMSYKILRKWTCYDWCSPTGPGNPRIDYQVIKILDEDPPVVYCPTTDLVRDTIGTDVWSCTGTTVLPEPHILLPGQPIVDSAAVYILSECSEVTYSVRHVPAANPLDCTPEAAVPSTRNVRYDRALDRWIAFDLPLGCNWFYYLFEDECGNQSECSFDIYVRDDVPPIPVCDEHTVVTLNDRGLAKVWAPTFDDGSEDNCGIDSMDVRRMTPGCDSLWSDFKPYVLFCCEDLGGPIMVEFRVWDAAGNSNTCMVEVTVNDKEAPKMIPPPDITVDCRFDFDTSDLSVFGKVVIDESWRKPIVIKDPNYAPDYYVGLDGWAWDNCEDIDITEVATFNLVCGVGTITRRFTATDPGGLFVTRVQTITFTDNNPFGYEDIKWPPNVTIYGCLKIDTDTSKTGVPGYMNVDCARPAATWKDQLFTQVPDACYKIERTWTVVDWCAFDLGRREWQWTYKQLIKVTDTVAPVFNSCEKVLFCDDAAYKSNGECLGEVDLSPDVQDACTAFDNLNIRYRIDLYTTGTFGSWTPGNRITGDYPVGEHTVMWEVSDGCGNTTRCTQVFEVKDCKKPTPYCRNGIITVLMENVGSITIWASDFNVGSFDNCTDTADLKYSFTPNVNDIYRTYTCDSLNGQSTLRRTIRMYVTDECGNQDFCETTIEIQDNGKCASNNLAIITGKVTDEYNSPVEDVAVRLLDGQNGGLIRQVNTNEFGEYSIPNVIHGKDYVISPLLDEDHLNGVSTRDLNFIHKELLGKEKMSSAYKRLAADANYTLSMTAGDIAEIRKLILGLNAKYTNNLSWRFMPADYVMGDVDHPWGVPEEKRFSNIQGNKANVDFIAMKIGDVDNSAELTRFGNGGGTRSAGEYEMTYEVIELGGDRYKVDFYGDKAYAISGLQMTLNLDEQVELLDVQAGWMQVTSGNFGDQALEENMLTFSWSGLDGIDRDEDRLMSLIVKGQAALNDLYVSSDITRAEAYDEFEDLLSVRLAPKTTTQEGQFALMQNVPNPFTGSTSISFTLPTPQDFVLSFYDPSGRVVKQIEGFGSKGENTIEVSESDFGQNVGSVIFYQLDTEEQSATRKLIILK